MDNYLETMGELIKLAHIISKNCDEDIFIEYSGHVQLLKVRVYDKGQKFASDNDLDPDLDICIWFDCVDAQSIIEALDSLKAYFDSILEGRDYGIVD